MHIKVHMGQFLLVLVAKVPLLLSEAQRSEWKVASYFLEDKEN